MHLHSESSVTYTASRFFPSVLKRNFFFLFVGLSKYQESEWQCKPGQ